MSHFFRFLHLRPILQERRAGSKEEKKKVNLISSPLPCHLQAHHHTHGSWQYLPAVHITRNTSHHQEGTHRHHITKKEHIAKNTPPGTHRQEGTHHHNIQDKQGLSNLTKIPAKNAMIETIILKY